MMFDLKRELLDRVKQNLILEHSEDDDLIEAYIVAAVTYAESYQHLPEGTYRKRPMPPTTAQAVIMLGTSMNRGTGARAVFSGTMFRPGSRYGTQ